MSLPVLRGPGAAINWTRKLQACGQAAALAGGTGNVRLLIDIERHKGGRVLLHSPGALVLPALWQPRRCL